MTIDRRGRILEGLDLTGPGLEIGAGYNPIAPKDEFDVDHLDHADQPALIAKYAAQGIDTSRIQVVDYVWSGQTYAELVGEKRYDWIIASHVIEHVPNPIGFLNDCAAILTDDGILSLVIPDKRLCFDYYRPPTSLARLIDASIRGDTHPTAGAVAEHLMYAATVNGAITWDRSASGTAPLFLHTAEQARGALESVVRDAAYHDVHAWAFTPSSFRLVAEDVFQLGLSALREASSHDTENYEFYVKLSRRGGGPAVDRATLASEALAFSLESGDRTEASFRPIPRSVELPSADDVAALARSNERGEIVVQSSSGHPQIYLIRDGVRHAIASPEWTILHGYEGKDVIVVDDDVIQQLAEGPILAL